MIARIRRGFREEHCFSLSLALSLSLFISAPVRRRSRSFGVVLPITSCHSTNTMRVRLITFRVAASLTYKGCARPRMRGMYVSYPTRIRAHGSRNPADIFLARRSLDYRDPSELRITCAATASAYIMTAITCTAFALRNAPQSKHIRLRYQGRARVVYLRRWRSMLLHGREMTQNNFFVQIDIKARCAATCKRCTHFIIISMYIYLHTMATIFFNYISRMRAKLCKIVMKRGTSEAFCIRI